MEETATAVAKVSFVREKWSEVEAFIDELLASRARGSRVHDIDFIVCWRLQRDILFIEGL